MADSRSPMTLPTREKRTVIVGSTGSGKTVDALFLLSTRDFDKRPWYIFDFKGDENIERLNAHEISIHSEPPRKPGLYVLHPIPELDDEAVTLFMWKIWERAKRDVEHRHKGRGAGVYIDEGFMIGRRNKAYNALLTQGRSLRIEMIILSQRPRWMNLFTFSEANWFIVKNLTLPDDRKHVSTFVGGKEINLLPDHHSYWYIADRQRGQLMAPVPAPEVSVRRINERLARRVKAL